MADAEVELLKSQLEPSPCGVEGHRQSDWVGPFDHHKDCFYNNETGVVECVCEVKNAYCSACRAVQEAVEAERAKIVDAMEGLITEESSEDFDSGVCAAEDKIKSLGPSTVLADAVRRAKVEELETLAKVICCHCAKDGFPKENDGHRRSDGYYLNDCKAIVIHRRLAELRRIP